MKVNFSLSQPSSTRMNGNLANGVFNKNKALAKGSEKSKDSINISPQGKMMSMIENLTKQKENLAKGRAELISTTLDNGGDFKLIENQLDFYDKQVEEIDKQISQIQETMSHNTLVQPEEEKKTKSADENKTDAQIEYENLNKIATAVDDLKQAEKVSSIADRANSEIRIDETEVKMSEIEVDTYESKALGLATANVDKIVERIKSDIVEKEDLIASQQIDAFAIEASQAQKLNDALTQLETDNSIAPDNGTAISPADKNAESTNVPTETAAPKPVEEIAVADTADAPAQ